MTASESTPGLLLNGLDGSNPLGFLAAIGTAGLVGDTVPELRLQWTNTGSGWRPSLLGIGDDRQEFCKKLLAALRCASMTAFDIDKKMPFSADKFSHALKEGQRRSSMSDRRDTDFLAGFGTDLYPDRKSGHFQDSIFRMVRSGDASGQGLPFYAKVIRKDTDLDHVRRTLFHAWDYRDDSNNHSLRWSPMEDQRYALRWRDPKKSGVADGKGTMWAANSLAIEALRWFPTLLPFGNRAHTTGFQRVGPRAMYFVWPIWTPPVGVDVLRSLLALADLGKDPPPQSSLAKRGIEEIYRSERIRQSRYYSNFAPAQPL